jgi:hypothetical protein
LDITIPAALSESNKVRALAIALVQHRFLACQESYCPDKITTAVADHPICPPSDGHFITSDSPDPSQPRDSIRSNVVFPWTSKDAQWFRVFDYMGANERALRGFGEWRMRNRGEKAYANVDDTNRIQS